MTTNVSIVLQLLNILWKSVVEKCKVKKTEDPPYQWSISRFLIFQIMPAGKLRYFEQMRHFSDNNLQDILMRRISNQIASIRLW